jgi:DNA-directed RNA polymerase specialized sigma24 family protein
MDEHVVSDSPPISSPAPPPELAFELAWRCHAAAVRAVIRKWKLAGLDADEIESKTMLRAHRYWDKPIRSSGDSPEDKSKRELIADPLACLVSAARYAYLDELRAKYRRPERQWPDSSSFALDPAAASADNPPAALARGERAEFLSAVLRDLPALDQDVLLLRSDGRKWEELAVELTGDAGHHDALRKLYSRRLTALQERFNGTTGGGTT